jgi:tetratricopeptide (TPR) repeat protein
MRGDHVDFRGGNFYGPVTGVARAPAPTALDSLPAKAAGFTGRDAELARLLDALDPAAPGDPQQAVLVTAVSGLGGIGKTALAVEAAHAARERGWFPGGVLFVDLHGHDDAPATAKQALRSLLCALGVEVEDMPATEGEQAALYRSMLARRGREHGAVLVLADNASTPQQVRPLLPGEARHRVLVTSRHRLPQLGARLVPLDQLTPEAAYDLLDLALRIAHQDDDRAGRESRAVGRLAELCGHLPLALQIVAALLVEDREKPVTELVEDLTASHDLLAHLDDGERSVRAAFDLSYRRLPAEQAWLLRLLALMPGTESGLDVIAALFDGGYGQARALLVELERAHLVEQGQLRGRWRMHDLVRLHAAGKATADERGSVRTRVLAHYLERAEAADARLRGRAGQPFPQLFRDREEAVAWFDRECQNLVAATQWAVDRKVAFEAACLAAVIAEYLEWRRRFEEGVIVHRAAQAAAGRAGDRQGEAAALNRMGIALRGTGRLREAWKAHQRAGDLYHALGNRIGTAMAASNLGTVLSGVGHVDEAVEAFQTALRLFRSMGDRHSEAGAWNNLGLILRKAVRVDEALAALRRALDLYRETGDRPREGRTWHNYGVALNARGRVTEAVTACLNSLEICEELQDWHGAGQTLCALALVHDTAGDPARARDHWLRAADAYERAGADREAAQARRAARLNGPAPTDKPTPASPPARTTDSAPPSPRPPDAPDTAGP